VLTQELAMSRIRLTLALRDEYEMLFQSCAIRPGALDEATRRATQIGEHQSRYQAIADACLVPWYLIGIIAFDAEGTPAAEPESSIWARFEGLRYGPQRVDERACELQATLNPIPGIYLLEHGRAGRLTSGAFWRVTGRYLPGDPRGA
jgi:hypothetical protein